MRIIMELVPAALLIKSVILGVFIYLSLGKFIEMVRILGLNRFWAYLEIFRCLPCTTFWSTLFILNIWWAMTLFIVVYLITNFRIETIKKWLNGR